MDTQLRRWMATHIAVGEWRPMHDPSGDVLEGIEGKPGVCGYKADGTRIGGDFIRMQPGAAFPIHIHDGEHELYFIEGSGYVHANGHEVAVTAGSLIHIPAEYPHSVWVPGEFPKPLIFVAVGYPHKHVDAQDRMQVLE